MNNNTSTKNYSNLQAVVNTPQIRMTSLGVILDATGTYKTDDSYDYVCKIRIIDDSFNPIDSKSNKNKNLVPYVYVFIFSPQVAQSPRVACLGDIIFLEDFAFDTYQDTLVRGTLRKYSKWGILDGFNQDFNFKQSSGYLELNSLQKQQINHLRKWSRTFFSQYSLKEQCWFDFKDFADHFNNQNMIYESKDVDLIVKVVKFVKSVVSNSTYTKIIFVDENLKEYFSEVKDLRISLENDLVVKLRSISIQAVQNTYAIEFFNYSEILIIPSFFRDANDMLKNTQNFQSSKQNLEQEIKTEFHLDKYQKEVINQYITVYKTKNQSINLKILKEFKDNIQILKEFDTKTPYSMKSVADQFGSLVMQKHANLPITKLQTLKNILEEVKQNKMLGKYAEQVYKVQIKIKDAQFTALEDILKFFNTTTEKIEDITSIRTLKDVSDLSIYEVVLQNLFTISDKSLKKNDTLEVYLQTADNNPNYIFDLWQIIPQMRVYEFMNEKKFDDYNEKFKKSFSQLLEGGNKVYDFILEICYGQKPYLRIIDTIFWFVNN